MAISSIGAGSGLPLDQLLDNLRGSENGALKLIRTRASTAQSRLSGYGAIKGAIETLHAAASEMAKPATFGAVKASVDGDAITAVASASASPGEYRIEVKQLATRQTLTSAGYAERNVALSNGAISLTITLANGRTQTIAIAGPDTSLQGIASAINGTTQAGISATLVNDGSAKPHRLMLAAAGTGTDAAVRAISVAAAEPGTDVAAVQTLLGFGSDAGSLAETPAKRAEVLINGIAVSSENNVLDKAIEGISLSLAREGASGTLTVATDHDATRTAVEAFVNAYNGLQGVIRSLTSYDAGSQTASPLAGDSLARGIQAEMRRALNASPDGKALRTLAQIGITTNPSDGKLNIDGGKLSSALKRNPDDVQALLAGERGIGSAIAAAAQRYSRGAGQLTQASENMSARLKELDRQYNTASARIDAKMELYRKQFVQLDATLARMNAVSSYLTQQLSMLGRLDDKR
jgi:flagellar hook-associated protein 2